MIHHPWGRSYFVQPSGGSCAREHRQVLKSRGRTCLYQILKRGGSGSQGGGKVVARQQVDS